MTKIIMYNIIRRITILAYVIVFVFSAGQLSYAEVLPAIDTDLNINPSNLPYYRVDIPEVTRFVNVPETTTAKLDFPIQLLTPEEQELLKKKHKKITQFMVIGTADGRLGNMEIRGNAQNFKDGNALNAVGEEYANMYRDGRVQLYLKGLIKGKYLLTARYDSTKDNQDHLYKYINPERYYPVYGDDSVLTNDADSQGKLFVKLERDASFAIMGNYSTEEFEATQLAKYNRVLSGAKAHYRTEDFDSHERPPAKLNLTAVLANTTQEEREDTFSGLGISGPFYLTRMPVLEYTERIRIETRDANQSDVILNTTYLIRDADYQIEYDNGRIFFKRPIPSRDENDDPVYIVVRYEYSANTDLDYDIMATRGELYLFPREKDGQHQLMVAGQTVNEQKDLYNWSMNSVDGILQLTPEVRVLLEYARSDKSQEDTGQAGRVEANANLFNDKLIVQGYASEIDSDFVNPVNVTDSGTQKYGVSGRAYLTDKISFIAEHWFNRSMEAHTYDRVSSVDGIAAYDRFFVSAGYGFQEYVDQKNITRDSQTHVIESSQGLSLTDNLVLSNTICYEIEAMHDYPSQYPLDYQRTAFTASPRIDIKMNEDTDLYLRHDITTNSSDEHSYIYDSNTTTIGVSKISPEGIRSYVEYGFTGQGINTTVIGYEADMPLTDRMSLKTYTKTKIAPYHTTENVGYNSRIKILDNLYGNFAFERNQVTGNQGESDYNSQSGSLEYIEDDNTAGIKLEHRDENEVTRYSLFGNATVKMAESTRFLGKSEYTWSRDKDSEETTENFKRVTLGVAHRPAFSNNLNFFGKYEYEENLYQDATIPLDTQSHIASVEGIYEPFNWFEVSGKYALKHYNEGQDNLSTSSLTDMFTVRPCFKPIKYVDITGIYRYLRNHDIDTTKHLASLEIGLTFLEKIRIAAGYNFIKYDDSELPNEAYEGYGAYVNGSLAIMEPGLEGIPGLRGLTEDRIDVAKMEMLNERIRYFPDDQKRILNQKYREAELLYREGKYKEAKALYKEITLAMTQLEFDVDTKIKTVADHEEKAYQLFNRAEQFYREKKYKEAKDLYEEVQRRVEL